MKTGRPLRSTAIAYASYDDETQALEIEFTNGRSYTHDNVPRQVYDALIAANSPGSYYNAQIRDRY
jgi:hypothetical protein